MAISRPRDLESSETSVTLVGLVLGAIRRAGVPLQRVRPVLARLSDEFGTEHVLASRALYTDDTEILYDFTESHGETPEARSARDLVAVRHGQRVFGEVVELLPAASGVRRRRLRSSHPPPAVSACECGRGSVARFWSADLLPRRRPSRGCSGTFPGQRTAHRGRGGIRRSRRGRGGRRARCVDAVLGNAGDAGPRYTVIGRLLSLAVDDLLEHRRRRPRAANVRPHGAGRRTEIHPRSEVLTRAWSGAAANRLNRLPYSLDCSIAPSCHRRRHADPATAGSPGHTGCPGQV